MTFLRARSGDGFHEVVSMAGHVAVRGYCAIGGFSLYMLSSAFVRYLYEISNGMGMELPAVEYKQHI